MISIIKHFKSFDSFIRLQYILRGLFLTSYYRHFGKTILKRLSKKIDAGCRNRVFLQCINERLEVPDNISELVANDEAGQISLYANRSLQHIFNLLGSGDVTLNPVDWHTDFKTGHKWYPGSFYKDYIQEGIETDSDVKVPRELSRCHHFLKLGLAYQLTKDERYAQFCVSQMCDWIKENPVMRSINWGCTMDVAIRAVNWIWTLRLISDSLFLTEDSLTRIKVSLYKHGWFIYRNPEKSISNNHNHYLADLAGQIHLGLIFDQMPEPKKWLEEGTKELFREIRIQILPSGMSYERSTNYNRLVLELLIVPVLLLKRNRYEIPSDIWLRLEKMFEFIMYSLKPDGTTPLIGDQDDGRLLPLGCELNTDYRYLLSLGSIFFKRDDFKTHGNGFNIYCAILGGLQSKEIFTGLPEHGLKLKSVSFPDSGFFIMRNEDNYLIFNASGKSLYPEIPSGTHTHSDLLSFELVSKGKTFLVDPGSYVYTADAHQRMLFRSTQMHNTVTVDGVSQNVIRKEVLWDFERNAIPEVLDWHSDIANDKIVAKHTGYLRLDKPVMHQRAITFNKEDIIWNIKDKLTGEGSHLFEWFFHFDSAIDFNISDTTTETTCTDGNNIKIIFAGCDNIQLRKEKTYLSKVYGSKEESLVLVASIHSKCPLELNIEISPL